MVSLQPSLERARAEFSEQPQAAREPATAPARAADTRYAQWTAASLFSGCGGLDLGFHQQGFRTLAAHDIDQLANQAFNLNLDPVAARTDLARVSPDLPAVDLLLAGAPCQGFSTTGKRQVEDPRNALIMRAAELVLAVRPRAFVMENVPAALSGDHGRLWRCAEDMLRNYGYNVRRFVAEGSESGIAQRRKRLFMICWRGSDCIRIAPDPSSAVSLGTALDGIIAAPDHDPVALADGSRHLAIARRIQPGAKLCNVRISASAVHTWDVPEVFGQISQAEREVLVAIVRLRRRARRRPFGDADPVLPAQLDEHLGRSCDDQLTRLVEAGYLRWVSPFVDLTHTYNGKYRRLTWDAPSPTVDTHFGDPGLFLHPTEHRGLSAREAARIQGFPDTFQLIGGRRERFRLIGNAVPPPMAARVARFVRSALL